MAQFNIWVPSYLSDSPGLLPELLCFIDIISDKEVVKDGAGLNLKEDTNTFVCLNE